MQVTNLVLHEFRSTTSVCAYPMPVIGIESDIGFG